MMRQQLLGRSPMVHFETFARLHQATQMDVAALRALSMILPAAADGERPVWPLLVDARGAHVLVATECQLPVGAIAVWHHKDTAEARLSWLGVAPAVSRRGIGSLLLEAAIATVAAHRAKVLTVRLSGDAAQLARFLHDAGFVREKGGTLRRALT